MSRPSPVKAPTAAGQSQLPGAAGGLARARTLAPPPDSLLCNYSPHVCHGERVAGHEFCLRHILCDKSAPYRPCTYTTSTTTSSSSLESTGGRCSRPAPRTNRADSYCVEHSRALQAARERQLTKKRPAAPYSVFLESLRDYKKIKVENGASTSSSVDPFRPKSEEEGLGQLALQLGSSSGSGGGGGVGGHDDDQEAAGGEDGGWPVGDTWAGDGGGGGDSDCDSVDSEAEDYLQHAGAYTAEEVVRTMRDKLIRLQKLYIDQFQRLVIKMREARRLYLQQVRQEREAGLVNIFDQARDEVGYAKLKALVHYHNPVGREALLARRHREKRAATAAGYRPPQLGPCQHALTSTTKCGAATVPMAKFCLKHILEEPGQILYRPCGVVTAADGPCETPVASLYPHATCVFHTKLLSPAVSPVKSSIGEVKEEADEMKMLDIKPESQAVESYHSLTIKPEQQSQAGDSAAGAAESFPNQSTASSRADQPPAIEAATAAGKVAEIPVAESADGTAVASAGAAAAVTAGLGKDSVLEKAAPSSAAVPSAGIVAAATAAAEK